MARRRPMTSPPDSNRPRDVSTPSRPSTETPRASRPKCKSNARLGAETPSLVAEDGAFLAGHLALRGLGRGGHVADHHHAGHAFGPGERSDRRIRIRREARDPERDAVA